MPVHEERRFFELLVLGGAQAGLSWSTILRKRENYRAAFDDFDPERVAPLRRALGAPHSGTRRFRCLPHARPRSQASHD